MLGNLPYFIALDREHEAVVIAFRGTYSVADVFTDAVALPQRADVWLSPSLRQVRAADLACFEQLCLSQFASPNRQSVNGDHQMTCRAVFARLVNVDTGKPALQEQTSGERDAVYVHSGVLSVAQTLWTDMVEIGLVQAVAPGIERTHMDAEELGRVTNSTKRSFDRTIASSIKDKIHLCAPCLHSRTMQHAIRLSRMQHAALLHIVPQEIAYCCVGGQTSADGI